MFFFGFFLYKLTRLVRDICYSKLGAVSWLKNVPHRCVRLVPSSLYHIQNLFRLPICDLSYRSVIRMCDLIYLSLLIENGPRLTIYLRGTILHPTYSTKFTIVNIFYGSGSIFVKGFFFGSMMDNMQGKRENYIKNTHKNCTVMNPFL